MLLNICNKKFTYNSFYFKTFIVHRALRGTHIYLILALCTNVFISTHNIGINQQDSSNILVVYPKKVFHHNRDRKYFHGIFFYYTSHLTFKTTSWNGGIILGKHIMLSFRIGTALNNSLASLHLYTL